MSYPLKRYDVDPTGVSPNNFVSQESHILGPKAGPYHPVAPLYGPYYDDIGTFRVFKNGGLLVPQVDYWGTQLVEDATAKFTFPVCELLILKGMNEGDEILIDYQCVGGLFQNQSKGIVDLYNAFLKDNRPIDWTKGLKGKPEVFPPAYHLHLLSDVVGWEYIIVAIERLINTISLRNVPSFEALIDWVQARTLEVVSDEEILNMSYVSKVVTAQRLLLAARKLNFNGIRFVPRQIHRKPRETFVLDFKSTNMEDGEAIFWNVRHKTSFPHMFERLNGVFRVEGNEGMVTVISSDNPGTEGTYEFVVELRRNSAQGPVIATSKTLYLVLSSLWDYDYGLLGNGVWSIPTTALTSLAAPTAESQFLIVDDFFYKASNG